MKKTFILFALGLLLAGFAWAQGSETFTNMPANNTSYMTRTWTGDDGVTWNAEGARTDQTLNGRAICWGNSGTRNVISPSYTGGMGTLTFKYVRCFTGTNARSLEVYVNNTQIGSTITVSPTSDVVVQYSGAINVSGNVVLEIRSTGAAQVKVDDIAWTGYTASNPTIGVNPASLTGFSYMYNAGPSAAQSFALTGSNLTANLAVAASTNYLISTSENGTYGTSLSYTPSSGSVSATVWVILKSGLAIGDYNGENIVCSSTGATSQNVACSGSVTSPPAPDAPVATAATNVANTGFTANWNAVTGATGYYLDVYTMAAGGNASDLFISEYVEGASYDKVIEIYNGTGASIDLSGYYLKIYFNGSTTPGGAINLSGTLSEGDTYIVAHTSANSTILALADMTSGSLTHNGNDAVGLFNGTTLVDVVGPIGDDSNWGIDVILQRKSDASVPSTTYSSADWNTLAIGTWTTLGSHTFTGSSTLTYVSGYEDLDVSNVTSYNVTGLNPGTTYYYEVRAYNTYGTSDVSNEIEVTTTSSSPVISVTGTLSAFETVAGTASQYQSYSVSGTNLTADITVTAPSGFELSKTELGTYTGSLTFSPTGGTVSAQSVYVRIAASAPAGSVSGNITHTSTNATQVDLEVSGTVYKLEPSDHVTMFACGSETVNSITVTWADAAKVTPDGYIIKGSDVGYSSIADPVDGVTEAWSTLVHTVSQGTQTYTFTGLAENTTYYFKIFPYTNSGTNINYKTDGTVPQDDGTTLDNYNLDPGDIAVIGYEGDSPDWFSIVLLVDIPEGTVVYFTDNGFNDSGALNATEGTIAWTVPAGGLTAGSVVNFSGDTWSVDQGSVTVSGGFNLAAAGDQIIVYQGSSSSPSFIYAISNMSWVTSGTITSNTTYLPTGLVDDLTAFDFSTENDNGYYNVIPFVGTPDELLVSIADETNWELSDTVLTAPTTWDFTLEEDVNPVELASFTATISAQNYITLTWVTQTETGMRGYYIYRDTDNNFAGAQNVSPLIPSANSSQTQTYVFEDTDVFETGTYFYWLQTNDMDGTVAFHGPVSVFYNALGDNPTPEIPLVTELHAVYPNPFNPLAFIPFSLAQDSNVSFKIYNARGQIVKHFELGSKAAGNYRITWDGTDYHGDTLSNGVYQIVMTAGSQVYQTKTTLLK